MLKLIVPSVADIDRKSISLMKGDELREAGLVAMRQIAPGIPPLVTTYPTIIILLWEKADTF